MAAAAASNKSERCISISFAGASVLGAGQACMPGASWQQVALAAEAERQLGLLLRLLLLLDQQLPQVALQLQLARGGMDA